ncbi:hypothetical protein GCM10011384_09280 [Psychrobacillus lasiicapitis]|nr:hypothetical protein GCM10011384_09280 [Psychrobacillus lasiicapitis]
MALDNILENNAIGILKPSEVGRGIINNIIPAIDGSRNKIHVDKENFFNVIDQLSINE